MKTRTGARGQFNKETTLVVFTRVIYTCKVQLVNLSKFEKNYAITFSLCAGRPGQSLPRPTKSEGAWRQTADHRAPWGPSIVTTGESWVWDSIQGGIVRFYISCAVQKI